MQGSRTTPGRETPIRRQYERLKAEHPGCVLLFQLGDFFEAFGEDARTVSRLCGVTLTSRELGKGDRVPLAGVPVTRLEHYLARLLEAGLRVAVAEQVEPPGPGAGQALVERVVSRVVTPGTLAEPGLLPDKENTYLAAVVRGRAGVGLAHVDVSTGDFAVTQLEGDDLDARLRSELERLAPAELLIPEGQQSEAPRVGHPTVCQSWRFDEAGARERLAAQLGVLSLEGFGCAGSPLAIRAGGAILSYLDETNRRLLPSLAGLRTYSTDAGMTLDGSTRRNLELLRGGRSGRAEGSLLVVVDRTRTPMGGRLLRSWLSQPLLDVAQINRRLDAVAALAEADAARGQVRALLARVGDLERQLGRVAQGVAGPRELRDLAESLRAVGALRSQLVGPAGCQASGAVADLARELDPCPDVVDLVTRGVALPNTGRTVRPGYSPELDARLGSVGQARRWLVDLERTERERTGIKSLKVGYNRVFGYYLEVSRPNLRLVPPEFQRKQTLVSAERFVTPALRACEARIVDAEAGIRELEREVFEGLLRQVAAEGGRLRCVARAVGRLDVFAALAEVARERGYCRPALDDSGGIEILDGRHPVVEASLEPGGFIPNDCRLDEDECRVMVLTGPNMAGKSTYLRQVALIVLLAQTGSFVPARAARIGVVDRIFTRVGAQDDLAAGASTFMVEMMEASSILRHATRRSLIVLDEIGRGTSTFDGLSIARAVVEEVHQRIGARALVATHFHELASLAAQLRRVRVFNAAVAEEEGEVVFLRRVLPGGADRSYGIQVARLAGLPAAVTRRAEQILRELEGGAAEARPGQSNGAGPDGPLQLALEGFGRRPASPAHLLDELLSLELATLSPLEALGKLWEIQRRAGRG